MNSINLIKSFSPWHSPPSPYQLASHGQKMIQATDYAWNYLGKITILTRNILKFSLHTCSRFTFGCCSLHPKVLLVITRLQLLSIIGIPFTIATLVNQVEKVIRHIQWKDPKGALWNILGTALNTGDLLSSTAVFTNATLSTLGTSPIAALSAMALPLSFSLVGMGSLSRSIQLARTSALLSSLNKAKKEHSLEHFFITQPRGPKARAELLQKAPAEAVTLLEKLQRTFTEKRWLTSIDMSSVLSDIERITHLLNKKMTIDLINLLSHALTLIGLCLLLGTTPAALPFLFMVLSYSIKISSLIYQDLID